MLVMFGIHTHGSMVKYTYPMYVNEIDIFRDHREFIVRGPETKSINA